MNPEQEPSGAAGREASPEVVKEAEMLNERADELAGQLMGANLDNIDPQEQRTLGTKVSSIIGALMTLGGAAFAYHETQGIDFSDINNAAEMVKALAHSDFFLGTGVAFAGVSNLLGAYEKLRKYITPEEGE